MIQEHSSSHTPQVIKPNQVRFIIDLRGHPEDEAILLHDLMGRINDKDKGRSLTVSDLALYALKKLDDTDIKKIQEHSLSSWERMNELCASYNQKNGTALSLESFLLQKLKLN